MHVITFSVRKSKAVKCKDRVNLLRNIVFTLCYKIKVKERNFGFFFGSIVF